MTINGHLLLLVLATGVFVRVWNGNSQPQIDRVTRAPREAVVNLPELAPFTSATVVVNQSIAVATTTVPAEENWTTANCPVPLPAGIAAGTYRMVDDTGRVARLEVAAADGTLTGAIAETNRREVSADFHATTVGGRRWYFVRLQSPVAVQVREETEQVSGEATTGADHNACLFRNRKFDFTGYLTPDQSDASAVVESTREEIARPDSPELPAPL